MLFGSQFGDWDNPDNFLKAPLASGLTLTNVWSGSNPSWTFHHMPMGHSIGYSALRNQNSTDGVYYNGPQLVHVALMGDPTLRMHNIQPPNLLTVMQSIEAPSVEIDWHSSFDDDVFAYNIYRSNTKQGNFTKINTDFVTDTTFVDNNPMDGNNVYLVRAVKLEEEGSGSYYNMSLGVIDSVDYSFVTSISEAIDASVSVFPNPSLGKFVIDLVGISEGQYNVTILDKAGKIIRRTQMGGSEQLAFDLSNYAGGIYFVMIENDKGERFTKRLVLLQ